MGPRKQEAIRSLQRRVSEHGYLISHWHNVSEAGDWLGDQGYHVVSAVSEEEALEEMVELREMELRGTRPIWLFRSTG